MSECTICKKKFDPQDHDSVYVEAGEWLAGEVWKDAGELCPMCLENRARLVMMYCPEFS